MSSSRRAAAGRKIGLVGSAAGLAVACLSLCSTSAVATEYQMNPRVEFAAGYNDNVNLGATNAIAAAEAMADARLDLLAQGPNWQWRVAPDVRGAWYADHSAFNSDGEFLNLSGQRSGARYTLSLYGYGASQSLVTSYLPTANLGTGLGVSEPGTTLVAPASIRQNLGYLRPSYTFEMTPRRSLELDMEYTNARYSRELSGYTDYRHVSGSAGLVLKASPTGSITLRASGGDFKPNVGLTTNTYGAEAQWDGKLSATKQYYLRLGAARTDFSGSLANEPSPASTTSVTGGVGTQWTYTLIEIFVDLTREVEPTGAGYSVNRDQLRLRVARRITPRLAAFLGIRAIHDGPLPGSVGPTVVTQRYNYAVTGFELRVEREFSLIGAYSFTDYHYGGPSAQSNSVRLSVVYEPHRPAEGPAITFGY